MGDKKSSKKEEQERAEKINSLQEMIATAERTITSAKAILSQVQIDDNSSADNKMHTDPSTSDKGQIVHGTFDGQIMIGEDGKQYPVPANYASKSKLVEGDMLKLTITSEGSFVYKQIGPIERKYLIGIVQQDERGNFVIKTDEKTYSVLLAAGTYFKIEPGDEVTIIVPKKNVATWGAVENIVRKSTDIATGVQAPVPEPETPAPQSESSEPAEDFPDKPSAIEKLEKEIEEERKKQTKKETILDEWTPDIDEMRKEAKTKEKVSTEID